MFDIGFWELFIIAVVALVVVGPERLPKLVRVTGLWIGRANASVQSIRREISQELRAEELKQALNKTIDLDQIVPTDSSSNSIADETTLETKIPTGKSIESDPIEKEGNHDNG